MDCEIILVTIVKYDADGAQKPCKKKRVYNSSPLLALCWPCDHSTHLCCLGPIAKNQVNHFFLNQGQSSCTILNVLNCPL